MNVLLEQHYWFDAVGHHGICDTLISYLEYLEQLDTNAEIHIRYDDWIFLGL